MKHVFSFLVISLLSTAARAQIAPSCPPTTHAPNDVQLVELLKLNQQYADAVLRNDAQSLTRLLADDYVAINSRGELSGKSDVLEAIANGTVKCDINRNFDNCVRIYNDVAVIIHKVSFRGSLNGFDTSGEYRATHTWQKREGRWVLVVNQATRALGPPKSNQLPVAEKGKDKEKDKK